MIERYRKKIDKIDREIIALLEKRFLITKEIIKYKREKEIKVRDKVREEEIIKKLSKGKKLDKSLVKKIYKLIFQFSRKG